MRNNFSEFVKVERGFFLFGDNCNGRIVPEDDETPQVKIWLDEFFIGKIPVTVAQWSNFTKATGYNWPYWEYLFQDRDMDIYPITFVNWNDCNAYCVWMSQRTGKIFRLPTEAQWEKACRGVKGQTFSWGNHVIDWEEEFLPYFNNDDFFRQPWPVGQRPELQSPFGCYDMWTNIQEWCYDWYDDSWDDNDYEYGAYEFIDIINPSGPKTGKYKITKGGRAFIGKQHCSRKIERDPNYRDQLLGFRVVMLKE